MSDDFEQERDDFIQRSGTPFSGYSRADIPFYHPASVRRGRAGVPTERRPESWGVWGVVVALILLFGAGAFFLTFDSLLGWLILIAEIALPVALLASLFVVRRRNRRRFEDLD